MALTGAHSPSDGGGGPRRPRSSLRRRGLGFSKVVLSSPRGVCGEAARHQPVHTLPGAPPPQPIGPSQSAPANRKPFFPASAARSPSSPVASSSLQKFPAPRLPRFMGARQGCFYGDSENSKGEEDQGSQFTQSVRSIDRPQPHRPLPHTGTIHTVFPP